MSHEVRLFRGCPDEALLEEVRRVAELAGKPVLSKPTFNKHSSISASTLVMRFGRWQTALERAGVGHMYGGNPGRGGYADETILDGLRRVARLVGDAPLTRGDFEKHTHISASTVAKRFGKWRNALERAGVGHKYYELVCGAVSQLKYSNEVLIGEVRRVARLVGKPVLVRTDFAANSRIGAITLSRRFGKWREVLEQAGLGHMYSGTSGPGMGYSDEFLLQEIRRVAALVDKPVLTMASFRRLSGISPGTIAQRFGRWRNALELAGVGHLFGGFGRVC